MFSLKSKIRSNKFIPWRLGWNRKRLSGEEIFISIRSLGNREFRTAKIIADHLRSLGIEVKENVGKTGVVGILRGGKPGPCVGLRADIDALPIVERTGLSFASTVKAQYNGQEVGVMHACGHDSHIAIMMTVAEILSRVKDKLSGISEVYISTSGRRPARRRRRRRSIDDQRGRSGEPKG